MRLSPRLHRSFIETRPKSASREPINVPFHQSLSEAPCTDFIDYEGILDFSTSGIISSFSRQVSLYRLLCGTQLIKCSLLW